MQLMARSSHAAWCAFLTVRRVPSVAARRSLAERLTRTEATQSTSSSVPGFRGSGPAGMLGCAATW
jgi:hypothetical protein